MAFQESGEVVDSKFPKEVRQFTWRIAEYAVVKNSKEMLEATSTEFEMGASIGLPVRLETFLQLYKHKDGNMIGIFVNVMNGGGASVVMVRTKICIANYTQFCGTAVNMMNYPGGYGWREVIPQNELLSKLPLDAQRSLPIQLKITLYNVSGTVVTVADLMPQFKLKFHQKMAKNLDMMYKDPSVFSTTAPIMITVVSQDGQRFPSNSMMLAARSPVFQTMFQTPMKEMKEGVVKMEDIGGDALEVFLHFMHTGVLLNKWKEPGILEELTCAAHKYLMQDLVEFLDEAIGLVCTSGSCGKMIRLAHRLELKKAEAALLKMWKQVTEPEEMASLLFQE